MQPPLQPHLGFGKKNRRAQNEAVGLAGTLWYNHPKPLNHQAPHDYLTVLELIPPGTPISSITPSLFLKAKAHSPLHRKGKSLFRKLKLFTNQ